jgi:hypothetical protein
MYDGHLQQKPSVGMRYRRKGVCLGSLLLVGVMMLMMFEVSYGALLFKLGDTHTGFCHTEVESPVYDHQNENTCPHNCCHIVVVTAAASYRNDIPVSRSEYAYFFVLKTNNPTPAHPPPITV